MLILYNNLIRLLMICSQRIHVVRVLLGKNTKHATHIKSPYGARFKADEYQMLRKSVSKIDSKAKIPSVPRNPLSKSVNASPSSESRSPLAKPVSNNIPTESPLRKQITTASLTSMLSFVRYSLI